MGEAKSIVCLANSRKNFGRCIAGKEVLDHGYGAWIRPVSARQSAEISDEERRYLSGEWPKVLDILEIRLAGAAPHLHQSENYVIDDGYYWVKQGAIPWTDLKQLVDRPSPLWTTGVSSYRGENDRVKADVAAKLRNSLMLIKPEGLTITVAMEGARFGNPRRRVRARFRHASTNYDLAVTDPSAEDFLLSKPDALYRLKETYLSVSLGEAHTDGWCYKLVAAVIGREPF